MRYILAFLACAAIFALYIFICVLLELKSAGGVLPFALLVAVMVATWKGIVSYFPYRKKQQKTTDSKSSSDTTSKTASDVEPKQTADCPLPSLDEFNWSTTNPLLIRAKLHPSAGGAANNRSDGAGAN